MASALPVAALAAAAVPERVIDPLSLRWWVTTVLLHVVMLMTYGAAKLPKWAKWVDGSRVERFEIVQGVLASVVAGNVAWSLFYHYGNQAEALCWVMVVIGAYFGEDFLRLVLDRFAGKLPGADKAGGL